MEKPGRNESCPCGSGKKYKKCCGSVQETPNAASLFNQGLKAAMDRQEFTNAGDLDRFVVRYAAQANQSPKDDFLGLSSEDMHRILYGPKEAHAGLVHPDFAALDAAGALEPVPHLLSYGNWLLSSLAEAPIKLTAAGFIPPSYIPGAVSAYKESGIFWNIEFRGSVNKESGLPLLLDFREILTRMGLCKVRKGELSITKKGIDFLAQSKGGRYGCFYRALGWEMDWCAIDSFQHFECHPLFQQSWVFLLHTLRFKARDWVPAKTLATIWIDAFPMILSQYTLDPAIPSREAAKDMLADTVRWYCFSWYLRMLGLIEFRSPEAGVYRGVEIRTTPLFDRLLVWKK